MKVKLKKKIVIPIVAAAVVGVAGVVFAPRIFGAGGNALPTVTAAPLARMDIASTVSVDGNVESEEVTNVYTALNLTVLKVNVEVGDRVNAGDVLAVLDAEDIEAQIAQSEASLRQRQATAQQTLNSAINDLETEKYNQQYNFDATITELELAVEKAKQGVETARLSLSGERLTLRGLRDQRREHTGTDTYEDLRDNDMWDPTYEELTTQIRQSELRITQLENNLTASEQSVKDAENALRTARVLNQEKIIRGEAAISEARLAANFTDAQMGIDQQRKALLDAVVTAPASGTVTAVFAKEGNVGAGLMFVIENTDKLIVSTKIEEYDLPYVEIGQLVKIESDGTGEEQYEGKITKIAPTAVKDPQGGTVDTTNVEFETEVGVNAGSKLRIGMNARLDIITGESLGVFAIPYDSLMENASGDIFVYVAKPNPAATEGNAAVQTYTVAEIPVALGLETDLSVEIISDVLQEGDLIISSLDSIELTDGAQVVLTADGGAPIAG